MLSLLRDSLNDRTYALQSANPVDMNCGLAELGNNEDSDEEPKQTAVYSSDDRHQSFITSQQVNSSYNNIIAKP